MVSYPTTALVSYQIYRQLSGWNLPPGSLRLPAGPPPKVAVKPLPSPLPVSHVTRDTFPACRPSYPDGPVRCIRRFLLCPFCLPRYSGGSACITSLSRPAQGSLTLRPAGLLNRPRRPWSRGFTVVGYPTTALVSYQIYRQLSGWNLPPLASRAIVAH